MTENITALGAGSGDVFAAQHISLRQRIGVVLALAGTLVTGSSCEAGNSDPSQIASPTPVVNGHRPDDGVRPPLPADFGPLRNNIIIATVAGESTSRGYNEGSTVQLVEQAQTELSKSLGGEITFTKPTFLGRVAVTVSHPENRCQIDSEGVLDSQFFEEFNAEVMEEAVERGYDKGDRHNPGLLIFVDYTCANTIRSQAATDEFTPENSVFLMLSETGRPPLLTVIHEMGHELGNAHGNYYVCKRDGTGITSIEESCPDVFEYFDIRNIMGGIMGVSNVRFNGYQQYRMGVLDEDQIIKVEQPGKYTVDLVALQAGQSGKQVLRIPRTVVGGYRSGGVEDYYWVELSQGDCQDGGCPLSVVLYTADSGNNVKPTDATKLPLYASTSHVGDLSSGGVVGVKPGGEEVFKDAASGLSLRIEDIEASGNGVGHAELTITLA